MHKRLVIAVGVMLAVMLSVGVPLGNAETGMKALVLDSSVSGGASSLEAQRAIADGFTVTLVDDATWASMTAAQFADYQLIIIGDPTCGSVSPVVGQNATALADAVMARAGGNTKAGNRILIGTDPVYHHFDHPGATTLINDGIDFAGVVDGATGLYLDTTCGDQDWDGNGTPDVLDKLLPKLTIATSNWTENTNPPCGGEVSLISNAAQFSNLHSSDLQGWFCSDHETFPTFPTDWSPLAIATDTTSHPTCGTDVDSKAAVCGEAYLLIAGSGITTTSPNLALSPLTDTNPVGTQHTVTATVTDPTGAPAAGVHVTFVVTGANAGASGTCSPATCNTDSLGHVTFTYTGVNAGDDTINASITVGGSTQTATAAKTWTSGAVDTTAPACALTSVGVDGSGRKFIEVTVQDTGSGLSQVTVVTSNNANTVVPPFAVGTTSALVVRGTKIDQALGAQVALQVKDVAGNVTDCDPVLARIVVRSRGEAKATYRGVPQSESFVRIANSRPGVRRVEVAVNGRRWTLTGLKAGEVRTVNVAAAMKPGRNRITIRAVGKPGQRVDVVIADSQLTTATAAVTGYGSAPGHGAYDF